jgi:hypothetical protein
MKIISTLFKFSSLLAADDHHIIKRSGLYKGRIIQKKQKRNDQMGNSETAWARLIGSVSILLNQMG